MKLKVVLTLLVFSIITSCNYTSNPISNVSSDVNQGTDPVVVGGYNGPFYDSDIRPLIVAKCAGCHGEGSSFGNWLDYKTVVKKKDKIFDRTIVKGDMPMGTTLSDVEKKELATWLKSGTPKTKVITKKEEAKKVVPKVETPKKETPIHVKKSEEIAFHKNIKPLVAKACIACHGEGSSLGNWMDYKTIFDKKEAIYERVVVQRNMPLGLVLSEEEVDMVREWIDTGAKEGMVPVKLRTYSKDIRPIVEMKCIGCHGSDAIFGDWNKYSEIYTYRDEIKQRVVVEKTMPLGQVLTENEIELFKQWLESGALE